MAATRATVILSLATRPISNHPATNATATGGSNVSQQRHPPFWNAVKITPSNKPTPVIKSSNAYHDNVSFN